MARDTRGPLPPETDNLRRVSVNPSHWRQVRRLLAAEALAMGLLGVVGLIGVAVDDRHAGWRVLGVPLTPWLSAVLVGIGAAAAMARTRRQVAKVFTLTMSAVAVAVMVICGVASAHRDPGPLGFTAPAILLWTLLFCWSIALAIWVLPDQIEGPAWLPRRRGTDSSGRGRR
ncbi:hypothetical protein BST22_02200 [Mycolicibacterium chubuense]|uniref:Uncharacterized protein n=1 Tax=Mycolicibacterium chubuense TaxID=1800 RepID=A0A0J6VUT7_MYCCU|nr:hypothetical protein [Mycolicibacterium chubuense]KMO73248.1 hypothetical protein MCHUDSM44219_04426 [Mycolicibacterium chubuense]ORA56747.1 hypothetical protein BST22_02200 [Mycolicibacterium chubuense]SPX98784.1 Uncharacterised protein [Mycolicibacterium chubuense]